MDLWHLLSSLVCSQWRQRARFSYCFDARKYTHLCFSSSFALESLPSQLKGSRKTSITIRPWLDVFQWLGWIDDESRAMMKSSRAFPGLYKKHLSPSHGCILVVAANQGSRFFAKKDSRGCPESLWKKQKEWRYHYTRILEAKPIKLRQWQPSKAEIVAVAM